MGSLEALGEEGMLGRTLVPSHTYTHNIIYICLSTYAFTYICIYTYIYIHVRAYTCVHIYVYTQLHAWMYTYVYKIPLFSLHAASTRNPKP